MNRPRHRLAALAVTAVLGFSGAVAGAAPAVAATPSATWSSCIAKGNPVWQSLSGKYADAAWHLMMAECAARTMDVTDPVKQFDLYNNRYQLWRTHKARFAEYAGAIAVDVTKKLTSKLGRLVYSSPR